MPFTNAAWGTPESNLSPEDYCKVCLIDENPQGQDKVKAMCHLPVRSTPGGPYNMNALRAAAAALGGARSPMKVKPASKRSAAKKLARLMREAGIEPGQMTRRMAG